MRDPSKIILLLKKHYPSSSTALEFRTPIEMLVSTVLSAQCTDARVNIVTKDLFKKYVTASDYANANLGDFEKEIKSTGFYRNKARNIIKSASIIKDKFEGKVPDKMEELVSLPGIGRKTANIILWNSFGIISGIPVDTHVKRVSFRLGLTCNKDPAKIEKDLESIYSRKDWPNISNLLIAHGRKICQARRPLCRQCFLYKVCLKKGVDSKYWSLDTGHSLGQSI